MRPFDPGRIGKAAGTASTPDREHRFGLSVGRSHERTELAVHGDLDRNSTDELMAAADGALSGAVIVIVDLTRATVVDSAALGTLIRAHRLAEERGGRLEIRLGAPYQEVLFAAAGLSDHLNLRRSTRSQARNG